MAQITYANKSAMNVNSSVPNVNKVNASDMNEIKSVVNNNYNEVGDITTLTTTNKTSVVNAINEVNDKGFISATKTQDQNIGTTGEGTITFDTIIGKSGTDFSFSNNTITCNFNGYVEVSAQVQWSSASSTSTHNIYIYQNGYIMVRSLNAAYTNGGNKVGWITPMILQVWNGNTFNLKAYSYSGEKINSVANGTHFTIKRL